MFLPGKVRHAVGIHWPGITYFRSKINQLPLMFSLNLNGTLLTFDAPLVMGILNVNSDSFYAGSRFPDVEHSLAAAHAMAEEGADILDVGGQSTRPGSDRITAEEELARVLPVINTLSRELPDMIISVDTYHAEVACQAVAAGARIVNDISAGEMDPGMLPAVAGMHVPYVCMHMQGSPETMQSSPRYSDVVAEVMGFFIRKTRQCRDMGIKDIILDPGFGFGKDLSHNFELLGSFEVFRELEMPLLAGLSRKSMIHRSLGITAGEALNGTTVLNTVALMKGADILRVHDVRQAKEAVRLMKAMRDARSVESR
jgi:dihydropteroate synthase